MSPDQELTTAQCVSGTTACERFLTTYPDTKSAESVQVLVNQLKTEKEQIEKGLVKFDNRWMKPAEKAAEKDVRAALGRTQQLRQQLSNTQQQRDQVAQGLSQAQLGASQASAAESDAKTKVDEEYWRRYWHERRHRKDSAAFDEKQNARSSASQSKGFYNGQIAQGEAQMKILDEKLNRLNSEIQVAEMDYRAAINRREVLVRR